MENKIVEHDLQLVKIETVLERVARNQDKLSTSQEKTNDTISSIAISIQKQELLLEKITNLETNTKDSFKRAYETMDEFKIDFNNEIDSLDKKIKVFDPISTLIKNKYLTLLAIIGCYSIAIQEVRLSVFTFLAKFWG